jgi:hypothetical protein
MPSKIEQLALEYKAELSDAVAGSEINLSLLWSSIADYIDQAIQGWKIDFDMAGEMTEQVRIAWLREQAYYQSMKAQLVIRLQQYRADTENLIKINVENQMERGVSEAVQLMTAVSAGILPPQVRRLPYDSLETLIGRLKSDVFYSHMLKTIDFDALTKLDEALAGGLALGEPLRQIARRASEGAGIALSRAMTITRTEIIEARRLAAHAQFLESAEVLNGWKRMANKKSACLACLFLDGTIYPTKQSLDDHPNGQCTAVPLVKGVPEPMWQTGKEYFLGLSPEQQQERMGMGRFEAWQDGQFELKDLVTWRRNKDWGDIPEVTPLWKLTGGKSPIKNAFSDDLQLDEIKEILSEIDDLDRLMVEASELDYFGSFFTGLTQEQEKAIVEYTKNAYEDINKSLRFDTHILSGLKSEIEKLDAILDNAPAIHKDTVVFRGIFETIEKLGLQVGEPWRDEGFMSTSIHSQSAGMIMQILIPEGSTGVGYIDDLSYFNKMEFELLIGRGGDFICLDIGRDEAGNEIVKLLYLGNQNRRELP